jgi:AraC family transcriptional regulator
MQEPRIETTAPKHIAGKRLSMTYAADRTPELFRSFMPHRAKIENTVGTEVYAVNVFPPGTTQASITGATIFEKQAAIEVSATGNLPEGMEHFVLPGGLYAVFIHKGPAAAFAKTFGYIFGTWLPESGYQFDANRPRFEKITPGYKPDDPEAEEEIWIPIQ